METWNIWLKNIIELPSWFYTFGIFLGNASLCMPQGARILGKGPRETDPNGKGAISERDMPCIQEATYLWCVYIYICAYLWSCMYIFITRCVCACNSQSLIKDWDEHHMVPMFGMTNAYGWSQGWSNPAEAGINIFQAWSLTFSQTIYENPANEHLDLQLALFSAHSSFYLDLHSFWISTLTWTRKRAFVSWRMGKYS